MTNTDVIIPQNLAENNVREIKSPQNPSDLLSCYISMNQNNTGVNSKASAAVGHLGLFGSQHEPTHDLHIIQVTLLRPGLLGNALIFLQTAEPSKKTHQIVHPTLLNHQDIDVWLTTTLSPVYWRQIRVFARKASA